MNQIDVHIRMEAFGKDSLEAEVLANVVAARLEISRLIEAE